MMRLQGFSLAELLVVLAIVALLSAVAIPSYNTYIVRARVLELLTVADSYKIKIVEDLSSTASGPGARYDLNSNAVDYVEVAALATNPVTHVINVVAKMKNASQAGIGVALADSSQPLVIQLQGKEVGEILTWTCHVAAEYNLFVSKTCQNNDLVAIT